jgi:AcrR family transcriptional regulator
MTGTAPGAGPAAGASGGVASPADEAGAAGGGSPRERLLSAARDVLTADGLEGLTLRAIARRAGVSHGAPLRHFPTLASLLAALAAEGFARLVATIDGDLAAAEAQAAAAGTTVGPRQRLTVAGRSYLRFALEDPGVFSVTFRPERVDVTDPDYQTQGFRSFQQLVDLVSAAQDDGWYADRPTRDLAAVVWADVHGLATLALHGGLTGTVGGDDVAATLDRLVGLSTLINLGPQGAWP